MPSDDGGSLTEAAVVGVFGGALGALVGWPIGLAGPFGVVGAANGVVSGWRRVYDWESPKGCTAVLLDSTWSLPMTTAALFANAVGAVTRGGYVDDLSRRSNRHVYQRGFMPRKGFAITLGNVISGGADTSKPRRRRLITDHEDVHVWQARWLGPLYPIVYVGWMASAGAVGSVAWVVRHRDQPLGRVVETYAYYLNPLEWWAYSRDDHWPPGGKLAGIGWKHPAVRSFSSIRRGRAAPAEPH